MNDLDFDMRSAAKERGSRRLSFTTHPASRRREDDIAGRDCRKNVNIRGLAMSLPKASRGVIVVKSSLGMDGEPERPAGMTVL